MRESKFHNGSKNPILNIVFFVNLNDNLQWNVYVRKTIVGVKVTSILCHAIKMDKIIITFNIISIMYYHKSNFIELSLSRVGIDHCQICTFL